MPSTDKGRVKLPKSWLKGGTLHCNICGGATKKLIPVGGSHGTRHVVRIVGDNLEYVLLAFVCEACAKEIDRS